jgi:acetylglutamate kinase
VATDFATAEGRSAAQTALKARFTGTTFSALKATALAELTSVAGILDSKAPEDAAAFKAWLQEVAQKAAEAGNEGGFLGFGGVAVSEAEKSTLAEISAALSNRSPAAA